MVLIRENLEKATIWQPVLLKCRMTDVPYDLAWPAIQHHGTPMKNDHDALALQGIRINDLSPLWPVAHFRQLAMATAKEFVAQMKRQSSNYDLVTEEGNILIYGPYRPRKPRGNGLVSIRGFQTDEWNDMGLLDFQIWANFVAKYGKIPEVRDN